MWMILSVITKKFVEYDHYPISTWNLLQFLCMRRRSSTETLRALKTYRTASLILSIAETAAF